MGCRLSYSPMINDVVSHACIVRPPLKTLNLQGLESFQAGEHTKVAGGWHA